MPKNLNPSLSHPPPKLPNTTLPHHLQHQMTLSNRRLLNRRSPTFLTPLPPILTRHPPSTHRHTNKAFPFLKKRSFQKHIPSTNTPTSRPEPRRRPPTSPPCPSPSSKLLVTHTETSSTQINTLPSPFYTIPESAYAYLTHSRSSFLPSHHTTPT
jgi:hypothetical protein